MVLELIKVLHCLHLLLSLTLKDSSAINCVLKASQIVKRLNVCQVERRGLRFEENLKIELYCSKRARFELHYFDYLISVVPFKLFKPTHYFFYNASLQYLSF